MIHSADLAVAELAADLISIVTLNIFESSVDLVISLKGT